MVSVVNITDIVYSIIVVIDIGTTEDYYLQNRAILKNRSQLNDVVLS